MKKKFTILITAAFMLLTMMATTGEMWGQTRDYEELYYADFTTVATHSYTQNKTFTLNDKSWTASVSQVNGGVFYLGCNSNNASKGVLNNNSTFSAEVAALKAADAVYNTNYETAHAYALQFDNAYNDVTKVVLNWAGGNNAFQVYLFGDSGNGYELLESTNYASSGASVAGSVEWTGDATAFSKFAIVARPGTTTTTATSKTLRAATFYIYKTVSSTNPSITAANVEIEYNATSGSIDYSIENGSGNVTASITTGSDWLTSLGTITEDEVPFTCSANTTATVRTATVTLSYEGATDKVVTITQAGNPNVVDNISDITSAGTYTVKGTIVAINSRGFILGDGTGYVYYYEGTGFTPSNYNIGDLKKISGAVSVNSSNKIIQYGSGATITAADESNYVAEDPTVLSGSDMDARVTSSEAILSCYVQYQGTLSVNNTYYNITNIDGASTAKGSISFPTSTDFTSLNGKVVTVTGYYVGVSSNQYYNTMIGSIEELITGVETPTFSIEAGTYDNTQEVELNCTTSGATIYYTLNGTDPTNESIEYSGAIEVSATQTIKAIAYVGEQSSMVATATYHICSQANPYSVAQANTYTPTTGTSSNVYIHGIVSAFFNTSIVGDGSNYRYYISDDGTTTDQILVYKGKGLNETTFANADDLLVGDIVTIYGGLTTYSNAPEIASGNYLVAWERPTIPSISAEDVALTYDATSGTIYYEIENYIAGTMTASTEADWISDFTYDQADEIGEVGFTTTANDGAARQATVTLTYTYNTNQTASKDVTISQAAAPVPSITVDPATVNAPTAGETSTLALTYQDITISEADDFDIQFYDGEQNELNGENEPDWLIVVVESGQTSGYVVSYTIDENTGDARAAYFKVFASGPQDYVYSNLVTINQAAGTTPPTPGQYDWVLTDLADLTANDVFVIVGTETGVEEDAYFALPNNGGTQNAPSAVSVTVSNNTLSGEIATTIQWNISGNSTDGYIFYPNGDTETWLYCNTSANSGSNNNIRVGSGDRKYFVLDDNDYIITNDNSVTRYLSVYNDQDWRGYIDTSHGAVPISFYKRVPASTEPSITLNQYTYNLNADGGDTELPVTTANLATSPQLAVVFYESDGTTTTTYDWISATINNAGNIAGHIDENEGAARTAYFKVSGLANDNTTTVYSDLVTINQAAATAPSIVFETASMDLVAGGEQDRKLSFDYSGLGSTPAFTINYYESNGTTAATAATYNWLTATIDANNKLNITAVANTGEARSAYLKVYGEKNANVHAESNLVTINQAAYVAPTYTVTYNANGGTGTMTDPNSPYTENAEVTLLENAFGAPEGKIWNSWLVQDANQTAIAVNEGKFNMPASNVTVTAQWVDDPYAPTYEWVLTALEDLTSSDVFVIVGTRTDENYAGNYAMSNNNGTTTPPTASAVTIANNKLSNAPEDNLKWNVSGNATDGFTFYPNGSTTTWLYCTSDNNGVRVGTNANKTFVVADGYLKNDATSRFVGVYQNKDWRCYTSHTGTSNNIKDQTFSYYKRQVASTDPSIYADDVDIESDAIEGEITYTLENEVTGGALTAEITAGNEGNWLTLGTVGTTVPFTCSPNTEATERTATVTLTYTYNAKATVTATAVVTQAALVIDFATMPFEFNGGRADIENTVGLTQNGIDTDYGSSPKLKFNTTGDWMILKLNAAPVSLSYDIKGNGFSGGTFTVQTSANGTDYSDLATYTTLGDAVQSITHVDLDANVHYIKWIYTYKKSGNVALGNIHATEHYDTYGDLTFDSGLDLTATSESLIVHEGSVVTISGDLINSSPDNLVIEDGGQLIYTGTEPVAATIKRSIADPAKDGDVWYTISSPVNNVTSASVKNLISSTDVGFTYDLYLYDEPTHYWINQKAESNQFTNLTNGRGYLYWNTGSDLEFAGTLNTTDVAYQLTYSESAGQLKGFNLIGNPFSHNIYKGAGAAIDSDKLANGYYTLSNDWAWQTNIFSQAIKPTQGILVQATEAFELTIVNSATPATAEKKKASFIEIVAGNKEYSDVAYVVFGKGIGLNKIDHINTEIPEVYFWQNNERFAVASLNEDVKEIALNFQAATEGSYDIKVDFDGDFNYLHLIDNMTGANVDLLQTPSYTFDANVTDYASRFRLVFSANHGNDYDEEIDNEFGFIDASGNLNILNNAGEATLQLVDVTGRIISSETFSGSYSKAVNASAGVYMLRLINGNNVKTQKIVIR